MRQAEKAPTHQQTTLEGAVLQNRSANRSGRQSLRRKISCRSPAGTRES
jgi:hypothetical protein